MKLDEHFAQYPSIPNNSKKFIEENINKEVTWIATEKVHGSNFSIITDGNDLVCAKRSCVLGSTENFFEHNKVIGKYKNDLFKIYKNVKDEFPKTKVIQIYGEIFGGQYPGYVVPHKHVQKDIYYTPDIEYIIFDIKVITDDEKQYLKQEDLNRFVEGVKIVPILAVGKLDDLLKINPVFQTKIPQLYGLQEVNDNFSEGLVIRINVMGPHRHPIKIKNPTFDEIVRTKKEKPKVSIAKLRNKLSRYATANRFNNVMSKLGRDISIVDAKLALKEDAIKDFEDDLTEEERLLYESCKDKLEKYIRMRIFNSKSIDSQFNEFIQ